MPLDPRLLPPVMRALIDVLGFECAIRLLRARGGQRVHVPVSTSRSLSSIVGADKAMMLCDRFGGQDIDLPKYDKVAQQLRNEMVHAERENYSLNQLAGKFNLSRRQIMNILRDDDHREPDLFDLS